MRNSIRCVAAIALQVTLFLPGAFALDITQYEIVKRDSTSGNGQRWVLHFLESKIEISLVPVRDRPGEAPDDARSLTGPDGFNVRWLIEDRLLWVSWRTQPQGNGVYYDEVHIIVDISSGLATELRRVQYAANGNQGIGYRQHLDVKYSYNKESRLITESLHRSDTQLFDHPYPLAAKLGEAGPYLLEENLEQVYEYSIHPDRLIVRRKNLILYLGEEKKPVDEVARFVILRLSPRYGHLPLEASAQDEITKQELDRVTASIRIGAGIDSGEPMISGKITLGVGWRPPINPRDQTEEESSLY